MIYFDHNATSPLSDGALDAMMPYLRQDWHNPSSGHQQAKAVRRALDVAREQVGDILGGGDGAVVFTSGGTESINTALNLASVGAAAEGQRVRVVSAAGEHSAAYETLVELQKRAGIEVVEVALDASGRLDLQRFAEEVEVDGTLLANVMWANNETGVVQDMAAVVEICANAGVALHSDVVQAVGKCELGEVARKVDFLSLSGHKLNGPKGIGALRVGRGRRFRSLIVGGGQEEKKRGGTENVPGIVGLGQASVEASRRLKDGVNGQIGEIRDYFEAELSQRVTGLSINGKDAPRLPNTSSLSFRGLQAEGLRIILEERGIICSVGSACSTGKMTPSRVLLAMGVSEADAKSTLRFSFSHLTTMDEVNEALRVIPEAVEKLRSVQAVGTGPVVVYGRGR